MANKTANCKFCSRTDNSIQVICEARCLICSRCQLMPGIRKLLYDHSNSNDHAATTGMATKGFCPICEFPMSPSMITLINSFKELHKQVGDEEQAKGSSEMILEENSLVISTFLKRFRNTYEDQAKNGQDKLENNAIMAAKFKGSDPYDAFLTPNKISVSTALEFVVDAYIAQWQSFTRNCNESMVTVMMRLSNKKKFSQRTNDFKTKSLIDFMSGGNGADSSEFILFGRLIGVQPKMTNLISPAWSIVTTSIYVIAYCERCLKAGIILDSEGNPNINEFKLKISKILTNPPGFVKTISLKKAIKILMLLKQTKHSYWTMSPLSPACIEYNCKLPWGDDSIDKLLNVLFYTVLFDGSVPFNASSADPIVTTANVTTTATANVVTFDNKTPASRAGTAQSSDNNINNSENNGGVSRQLSRNRRGSVETNTSSQFGSPPGTTPGTNRRFSFITSDGYTTSAPGTAQSKEQNRVNMLKALELIVSKVWSSSLDIGMSTIAKSRHRTVAVIEFLRSLDKPKGQTYIKLDYNQALQLCETYNYTINLADFALVCVECWEVEYRTVQAAISKGKLTSQRRVAISGHYDESQAKMTNIERLAMNRLINWYSLDLTTEFNGIDWDDVETAYYERSFPFAIPSSLMQKSRNELNYLANKLWEQMLEQREKDILDDTIAEDGPYSMNAPGIRTMGTTGLLIDAQNPNALVTSEDIERYNREQYLSSQSIGHREQYHDHHEDNDYNNEDDDHHRKHNNKKYMGRARSMAEFTHTTLSHDSLTDSHRPHSTQESDIKKLTQDLATMYEMDVAAHTSDLTEREMMNRESLSRGGIRLETLSPSNLRNHNMKYTSNRGNTNTAATGNTMTTTKHTESTSSLPLASMQYASPHPSKHPVNIVDVMDIDPSALTNAKLLSEKPNPEITNQISLSTNKHPFAAKKNLLPIPGQQKVQHESGYELTQLEVDVQNMKIHGASYRPKTPQGLLHGAAMNNNDHSQVSNTLKSQEFDNKSLDSSSILNNSINNNIDDNNSTDQYATKHVAYRKSRIQAARSRVKNRIKADIHMALEEAKETSSHHSHQHHREAHELHSLLTMDDHKNTVAPKVIGVKITPYVNLCQYINKNGENTMDFANNLTSETAVQILTIKNAHVNIMALQNILNNYLKPWQLDKMLKLDLSGNSLGLPGARLLTNKLTLGSCHLIHLNLNGVHVGDLGLRNILQAMISCNGNEHLLRLDIQDNDITIATDSISALGKFTKLRALDMSRNCFSLDTKLQCYSFTSALSPLAELQSLSVAFNKIQDNGFIMIVNIVKEHLHNMKTLDFASCFITSKAFPLLLELLDATTTEGVSKYEEILFHGNLITSTQIAILQQDHLIRPSGCRLSLENHYHGIEYPLRYDLRDYGINSYL